MTKKDLTDTIQEPKLKPKPKSVPPKLIKPVKDTKAKAKKEVPAAPVVESAPAPIPKVKAKRVMSEKQLGNLKLAREKRTEQAKAKKETKA